ncbi:unnamed protein product [Adineta steineri]|uniref:Uncharacterized protein n=1 Tax=Adineta steineri TaxID=433720 RepID=A0A813SMH3_9BILA|nr:unnamed protein product [Adineta steineri]CAF3661099.1 unnamed protein product [Adineta steineri]CAF4085257.1 unnamed protein product [Adineta steineri]
MAESQSPINISKYELDWEDWKLSDQHVITKMKGLIEALKSQEVDAVTILPKLEIGWDAAIHIFGENGRDLCKPEVVSIWLSLLLTLASSKGVTGASIASSFAKSCGGCMVYTILTAVGCFHSEQNVKLAFDFFCHILADVDGKILELDEVRQLSSFLVKNIPDQTKSVTGRSVCLTLHCYYYMNGTQKTTVEAMSNLIEGLGVLCTSKSFVAEMRSNPSSTIEILKQSIMDKSFTERQNTYIMHGALTYYKTDLLGSK